MYQRYLQRIHSTAEFLAPTPHPDQVIDFLSGNISPRDEVAVAFRGAVQFDGVITCENLCGFSKHEFLTTSRFRITDQRPISIAARTQKTVWATFSNVMEKFSDFKHFDKLTPWESMVAIPINLTQVYSFSFPSDLSQVDGIDNYLESIKSLLKVYESSIDLKKAIGSRSYIEKSEIQPLTNRQEKILEYVKNGATNREIADLIGYSESLVRHETMIIYKKLRVDGRHQLRENS